MDTATSLGWLDKLMEKDAAIFFLFTRCSQLSIYTLLGNAVGGGDIFFSAPSYNGKVCFCSPAGETRRGHEWSCHQSCNFMVNAVSTSLSEINASELLPMLQPSTRCDP